MTDKDKPSLPSKLFEILDPSEMDEFANAVSQKVGREAHELLADLIFRLGSDFRIGIITALYHEQQAIQEVVGNSNFVPIGATLDGVTQYYEFSLPCSIEGYDDHKIVLCRTLEMGNNAAAVAATSMLKDFPTVEGIIMVGIAGGMPHPIRPEDDETQSYDDHVRLGDIVVTGRDGVFQYDFLKIEYGRKETPRAPMRPSWAALYQVSENLVNGQRRNQRPWDETIALGIEDDFFSRPSRDTDVVYDHDGKTPLAHPEQERPDNGQPLVHQGRIGSANILLKDSKLREQIQREYKLIAVEMEGSGIADAAWNFGKGYIVIRGICDYCDMKKIDVWQNYAALVAAAFTRCLIERLPSRRF